MRRAAFGFCLALAYVGAAHAQSSATSSNLTSTQLEGRRLFGQDCGVCHVQPTITSGRFGPILSQALVKGDEAAIADFISKGSDRMPGFQYYYTPAQIRAIVAYLATVPSPTAAELNQKKSTRGGGE